MEKVCNFKKIIYNLWAQRKRREKMKNINDNLDLTILELQMLKDMLKDESFYTYNDVKVDTQRNVVEGKLITVLGENSIREEKIIL